MFKNRVEIEKNEHFPILGKAAFILVLLLLLSTSVFAIRLIDPISKELSKDTPNYVGTVAVGNTIELIFSKELTDKYEELDLATVLPDGFSYNVKNDLESIKMFISVPADATVGDYALQVQLKGSARNDTVPLYFTVVKSIANEKEYLLVSPSEIFRQETNVDGSAEYKLTLENRTDAQGNFTITTDLPSNWMNQNMLDNSKYSKVVTVAKGQKAEEIIVIHPRLEGDRQFKVTVAYEDTSKEFGFEVKANPTLKSKLEASVYGMPFYSFSLMPSYFLSGLLSFLTN